MKTMIAIASCLLLLSGCSTPVLDVRADSIHEEGPQLLWGERRYVVVTPQGGVVSAEIDKKTLGIVGGALGGAAIGAVAGNPAAGATIGATAGAISDAIHNSKENSIGKKDQ